MCDAPVLVLLWRPNNDLLKTRSDGRSFKGRNQVLGDRSRCLDNKYHSGYVDLIAIYCWTVSGERQSLRYRRLYYDLLLKQEVHWYDINNPNELSTKISTEVTAIQGGIG